MPPHKMRSMVRRVFIGLDVVFMAGRFLSLLPLIIISKTSHDLDFVAAASKQFQIALFCSSLALYAAPQIYLVKTGVESRVFPYSMAISTAFVCAVFGVASFFEPKMFSVQALLYFTLFRSYYIYFATRFRNQAKLLLVMLSAALASLATLALSHSLALSSLPLLPVYYLLSRRNGLLRAKYALLGLRSYFTLHIRNFFYFVNVLFSQVYTQLFLFAFAFFAGGTQYLLAVHAMYLYNIAFIFHQIVFRQTLSSISSAPRSPSILRAAQRQSEYLSVGLGGAAALIILSLYKYIENVLFGLPLLAFPDALFLGSMIILQSFNYSWAAVLTATRNPKTLLFINITGTMVIAMTFAIFAFAGWAVNFYIPLIAGLITQCAFRVLLGRRALSVTVQKAMD